MAKFIPWNSQPIDDWASKYATGEFIDLMGRSTHYIVKGSGKPIILIHGFFFDSFMWDKNIDSLSEKFKVYSMDLWGFGYSTREPLNYGYQLFTKQLLSFMDALNIEKAHLIGQSMGAGTIINFSISNPERVDRIVLVDAAGMPNPLPIMGRISNLPGIGEMLYSLRGNFVRKFTLKSTFLHNQAIITDEFIENATRFQKVHGSSQVMLTITRSQFFDTLQNEINTLASMDIPILIVWGRNEKSIPLSTGRKLHEILQGSRFEVLNGAGHCPNIDQADIFNQRVLEFLTSD